MKIISKIRIVFFVILLFSMGFFSCDKNKSMPDVKFETELGGDLNIDVGNGMTKSALLLESYNFSKSASVKFRSDTNIDKYFDNLKNIEIQQVNGTVKYVIGAPVTITNATLVINSGDIKASWYIKNFKVESGAMLTLNNNNGQWDIVSGILNAKKDFTIKFDGTTNKNNVSFVIFVAAKVKVTASPIKQV